MDLPNGLDGYGKSHPHRIPDPSVSSLSLNRLRHHSRLYSYSVFLLSLMSTVRVTGCSGKHAISMRYSCVRCGDKRCALSFKSTVVTLTFVYVSEWIPDTNFDRLRLQTVTFLSCEMLRHLKTQPLTCRRARVISGEELGHKVNYEMQHSLATLRQHALCVSRYIPLLKLSDSAPNSK